MSSPRGIEITVVEEHGLNYKADVLVLKHAQALHGLDARAVKRLGLTPDQLPGPDSHRVFRDPGTIAAHAVVFVGVRPIGEFTYSDIRTFGSQALGAVAATLPEAGEIALTLHGVGFGLDEAACLEAELAGILDAVESNDLPGALRQITFLEINSDRASRMRTELAALLGADMLVFTGARSSSAVETQQVARLREVARAGAVQEHAFVAMPFDDALGDMFHYGLSSAVRECGLLCERMDEQAFTGDVLARLKDQIRSARLVVAVLTGDNPNVYLEVGYAWGSDVPTVLVCHEDATLRFDVQGQRCLLYSSIHDLEGKLTRELRALLAT